MDDLERASHSAGGEHELASEVSERIRAVISSAEAAANAVRHEAEQRAAVKRRLAEEEARRIVDDARRDAEAYLAERIRRISELSDAMVERGEGIVMRLDRAEEVRRQLQGLADALGESAEELARELGGYAPERRDAAADRRATLEAIRSQEPADEPAAVADDAPAEAGAEIADDPTVGELATEASEEEAAAGDEPDVDAEPAAPALEAVRDEAQAEEEADDADRAGSGSREPDEQLSARLVALQMAVAGGKREEVESHLKRTFDLGDVDQILDDVFGAGDAGSHAR